MRHSHLGALVATLTALFAGLLLLSYSRSSSIRTPTPPRAPTKQQEHPSLRTDQNNRDPERIMASLKPLTFTHVLPKAAHTASVIFIHGLGDSGAGWLPVASQLSRDMPHVKWILPNARMQPVTINHGIPCPSWYDIMTLGEGSLPEEEDEKGLLASVSSINELITKEVEAGVPSERIVVGGFSQGGAVSYWTGLTSARRLAGLVVLSGYLPLRGKLHTMISTHAPTLPLFVAHGIRDPVVLYTWGQASTQVLMEKFGLKPAESGKLKEGGITFKAYPYLTHSASEEEIVDLRNWLREVLPQTA